MSEVVIPASNDGAYLKLSWLAPETLYVSVGNVEFSGTAAASTFMVGPPLALFEEIAQQWRGWEGEKQWSDLEQYVSFSATSDSVGHVKLRVRLQDASFTNSLEMLLVFEAGQLEVLARTVAKVFEDR